MNPQVKKLIFRSLKFGFLSILFGFILFAILFPFNDLGDFVSAQIAQQTQNQVQLQFDYMTPTFQPQPGVRLENVFFQSSFAPSLKLAELAISPALSALTSNAPHGKLSAEGLFGGEVEVTASPGEANQEGLQREHIVLELESLDLTEALDFANVTMDMAGKISGLAEGEINLQLEDQPEVDLTLNIKNFKAPAVIPTPMGELALPNITFEEVRLKGRLSNGQFIIEESQVGTPKDSIQANIKGTIAMRLVKRGPNIAPLMGSYNLEVKLQIENKMVGELSLFLPLLDGMFGGSLARVKKTTPKETTYSFKIAGQMGATAKLSPL